MLLSVALCYACCRQVQQLQTSGGAGASEAEQSLPAQSPRTEDTQSAAQLAAAQDACSTAQQQVASLQQTVEQLTGAPLKLVTKALATPKLFCSREPVTA